MAIFGLCHFCIQSSGVSLCSVIRGISWCIKNFVMPKVSWWDSAFRTKHVWGYSQEHAWTCHTVSSCDMTVWTPWPPPPTVHVSQNTCCRLCNGKFSTIHPAEETLWETANCLPASKWKWLLVNSCEFKSPICTATKFLNSTWNLKKKKCNGVSEDYVEK